MLIGQGLVLMDIVRGIHNHRIFSTYEIKQCLDETGRIIPIIGKGPKVSVLSGHLPGLA